MTATDKAKLDALCAEARARLDAIDEAMYQRGFVTCNNSWRRPKQALGDTSSKAKQSGPSPLGTLNPVPLGVL